MCEHLLLRVYFVMNSLAQVLGARPIESPDRTRIDDVPAELRPFLPEGFDVEAFNAYRVPLPLCAEFCTQQIVNGLDVLRGFHAERLLTVRYEDFFGAPKSQFDRIADFLGDDFVDKAWSTHCAALVHKPRSGWRDLPDQTRRVLVSACAPGFERLRAAGVNYDM
jgi:hypothetical protein